MHEGVKSQRQMARNIGSVFDAPKKRKKQESLW